MPGASGSPGRVMTTTTTTTRAGLTGGNNTDEPGSSVSKRNYRCSHQFWESTMLTFKQKIIQFVSLSPRFFTEYIKQILTYKLVESRLYCLISFVKIKIYSLVWMTRAATGCSMLLYILTPLGPVVIKTSEFNIKMLKWFILLFVQRSGRECCPCPVFH